MKEIVDALNRIVNVNRRETMLNHQPFLCRIIFFQVSFTFYEEIKSGVRRDN